MKKISLIIFLFAFINVSFSQTRKERKADQLFNAYSYTQALEIYKFIQFTDTNNIPLIRKIALSFNHLNQKDSAQKWYARLFQKDTLLIAEDYYNYSEILKNHKQYAESDVYLQKYKDMQPSDSRAERKLSLENYASKLSENKEEIIIKNLSINTSSSEFAPAYFLSDKIVFTRSHKVVGFILRNYNRTRAPFLRLFESDIDKITQDLLKPKRFSHYIENKFHNGAASFSEDGQYIFFTQNYAKRKSKKNLKIVYTVFKNGAWEAPEEFPFNKEEYSNGHPYLSKDGKTLYFASDMPGGYGGSDLYYSTWNTDGTWNTPVNLGSLINTEGHELFPCFNNQDVLYFASDGLLGLGGLDVYKSYWDHAAKSFKAPINMDSPINSSYDDFSLVTDTTGIRGYFASNRPGGKGEDDLYYFVKKNDKIAVSGIARDKSYKGTAVSGASIILSNSEGVSITEVASDADGKFTFGMQNGKKYKLKGEKAGYLSDEKVFVFKQEDADKSIDLELEKILDLRVSGIVKDEKTKLPLEGVTFKILEPFTNLILYEGFTKADGEITIPTKDKKIGEKIECQIKLDKQGYLAKVVPILIVIKDEEPVSLNEIADINLDKIEIGVDIGKLVDLEPIYFDLGKWNIRPDAAKELDKIVNVMFENLNITIELGSHCDSRGNDAENLKLSDKRAKSSAEYIISKGIEKSRISGKGYGEKQILNHCKNGAKCTEEEHQLNRRTEFKVVKM